MPEGLEALAKIGISLPTSERVYAPEAQRIWKSKPVWHPFVAVIPGSN